LFKGIVVRVRGEGGAPEVREKGKEVQCWVGRIRGGDRGGKVTWGMESTHYAGYPECGKNIQTKGKEEDKGTQGGKFRRKKVKFGIDNQGRALLHEEKNKKGDFSGNKMFGRGHRRVEKNGSRVLSEELAESVKIYSFSTDQKIEKGPRDLAVRSRAF